MRRYPLLPIAAAFAAGIAAAPYFYLTAAEQIGLLTAVVLGTAILLWKNRLGAVAITASVGLFLCGTFFAAADHHDAPPGSLPVLAAAGAVQPDQPLEIIGWARTPTKRRPGNESFDLEVEQIRQAGNWLPARGGIRVYYFPNADGPPSLSVAYGTRLLVSLSELRRPRNFLTPGSFDWEAYLRRQGIDFTARVRRPADLRALSGRRGNGWRAAIFDLRGRLLARIDQLYAEPKGGLSDHGAILKAMLLGDDDWLRPPVESAFQASGTYHILVVSGWNVFALAIPLLWLANRWRFPEWLTAGAVAAAVIGFALLAEGGAPVARAALMFLIYLLARFLYRDRAGLNSIAAAALLLLAMRPSDLRDPGFQLSFFAVLVLAAIAVPLVQWVATPYRQALRRPDDRNRDFLLRPRQQQFRNDVRVLLDYLFGRRKPAGRGRQELRTAFSWCVYGLFWVAEGLLFTAVVQMGLSLAMALHFHRLAWSGVFANLLVLPVASGMVMIGLPLLLLSLLWPAAAPLGAGVLGAIAAVLHWMVQTAASWDILNYRVPAPPRWVAATFVLLLLALAIQVARRSRWAAASAGGLAALCVLMTVAPYQPQLQPGRLEVVVLDVGQGDSIFLAYPDGTTMLLDAGGAIPIPGAPPPRLDIGESVISPYLWSRHIRRLDYVVLTHDHWDHFGGLPAIFRNFRVGELWMGPDPADRNMEWLHSLARRHGILVKRAGQGVEKKIGGVSVAVLSPPQGWAPRRVSNDDSIVLRLGYKRRHVLLPGDVEARMERRLAQSSAPLASEVFKVAHHGSRTSTTADFLARVNPQFGIISVGAFRRFGHPHTEVLEALRKAGVQTYRTDRDGSVTVSTDGHRIDITAYRGAQRAWPPFLPKASSAR